MTPSLQLGESRIPELCKKANMSQAELARRLRVSRQFIYKVNKRQRDLSLQQAINVANILDCKVEDLHIILRSPE